MANNLPAKTPPTANTPPPIEISLSKAFEFNRLNAFLLEQFTAWEKGRTPFTTADGKKCVQCDGDVYAGIIRAAYTFVAQLAADVVGEAVQPIRNASFAEGVTAGGDAVTRKLSKIPAIRNHLESPLVNSESLVKSIGEEIRKAFEAGQSSIKSSPAESMPRVASARQVVQRDRNTGEITATVVNYQYDDVPGVQPPPL